MKKSTWVIYSALLVTALFAGVAVYKAVGPDGLSDAVELDWRQLGEYDYVSAKGPQELESLDGKLVKIPGFMVPLEDNVKTVVTFLLVPSPQACIHVPPPPPNQMVLVEMDSKKGSESPVQFGPIWVYGKLSLKSKKHLYGESSFTMVGLQIEAYR